MRCADQPLSVFDTISRLWSQLPGLPKGPHVFEGEVGPLLTKDAQSSTPLLPTLRAFLSVDGRKTESAEMLYVQRRTLYNRLARISKILGKSLDEPETRQRLLLTVKGLELLEGSAISSSRLSRGGAGFVR